VLVVVASVATVTACGGGTSPTYAGMSAPEAASQSLDAAAHDTRQQGNPLQGLDVQLERVVRGHNGKNEAWVVVLKVGKRGRACVWMWAEQRVISTTYRYFVDTCTAKVLRAKPDIDLR
jgi:5-hydroxyisourate hydrolase-like protein (transthyretin family)